MIGEEVLAQGHGLQPDMVLVDLAMPGLSGPRSVSNLGGWFAYRIASMKDGPSGQTLRQGLF